VSFSYKEVVGIMGRSNLYTTGSEFLIHIGIRNHRNHSVRQRKMQLFSYDVLISFILRVYRYSCISKHGLRTGGSKFKEVGCARLPVFHNRVFDMPEMPCLFLVLYLSI